MKTPKIKTNDVGARFAIAGSACYRWHESPAVSFRLVGRADKLIRLRHTGWYCDTFQEETTHGVVYRLSHERYLAGCTDPNNDGPAIMEDYIYTDEKGAAIASDRIAQLYGELCVADCEKFQAEQRQVDARDRIVSIREEIRELVAGIRESVLAAVVCNAMKREIRSLRNESHKLWTELAK